MSRFLLGILVFAAVVFLGVYFFFDRAPESTQQPEPPPSLRGPSFASPEKSPEATAKKADDEDDEDDEEGGPAKGPDGFTRTEEDDLAEQALDRKLNR